jgi:hypothetical protein
MGSPDNYSTPWGYFFNTENRGKMFIPWSTNNISQNRTRWIHLPEHGELQAAENLS